jgi:elongation factor G
METTPENIRNVALIGHKGSGKTSLAEAMLFLSKATPRLGSVADGSSMLDDAPEEKEKGATLEASIAHLRWNDHQVNLIDTPGEAGFWADTRLALAAVESAVLVVSARDGIQPGHERLFKVVKEQGLPCAVVITKMDVEHARPEEVVAQVKTGLKVQVAVMEVHAGAGAEFKGVASLSSGKAWVGNGEGPLAKGGDVPEDLKAPFEKAHAQLMEDVAATDDALTEKFLSDGVLAPAELDAGLLKAMKSSNLVPVFFASTLTPRGVTAFLDAVVTLFPPPFSRPAWKGVAEPAAEGATPVRDERPPAVDAPMSAFVFKTRVDPHAGRYSYTRVLSGVLKADSNVIIANSRTKEHIGTVAQVMGRDVKSMAQAVAGDIVVMVKTKAVKTGETVSDEKKPFVLEKPALPPSLLSRAIMMDGKGGEEKLASALARMADEDPALVYGHDEVSRAIVVSGPATVHLDMTVERIRRRANVECRLGPPKVPYRETVTKKVAYVEGKHKKQSGGHGQFGVCYIDVEPVPRGTGFVFEDAIVGGVIARQFIPSVEKGIVKCMARGIIAGFPFVDVRVRLVDGKMHPVDSSDAAFQIAGSKGFRIAANQAGPVILEPVVKMEVVIPNSVTGDVIGELNSRRGKILGTDMVDDSTVVSAYVPMAESFDFEARLNSLTQGKGTFVFTFDHYDPCPPVVQEKVIKDSGFKVAEEDE